MCRRYEETVTRNIRKKIAFDFDGTLLDSRKRHGIVMSDVLKKHGINIDTSDLVSFKAEGHNNIAWLLSNGIAEDIAKKLNSEWISRIENEEYLKSDVLYPDALEVLENLSKENDLYLVTARNNEESALNQIKDLGINQYFSQIFVVESNSETPALKAKYLSEIKADVFVGDTESDYKAALIAECEFKAISSGFRDEIYWKNRIDKFYNSISDFVENFTKEK